MDPNNKTISKLKFTRRRFFLIAGLGISAVGLNIAAIRWRNSSSKRLRHVAGNEDFSDFDTRILENIILFFAVLFGISFNDTDKSELLHRLTFSTQFDNNWREDYREFTEYLDNLAKSKESKSFSNAPKKLQTDIVSIVISKPNPWSRQRRVRAFLGYEDKTLRKIKVSTVPHLVRLYTMSGVPWRHRGYKSWPGVAGDTFSYTSAITKSLC